MKKVIAVTLLLSLMSAVQAFACTTILVTKGASADGSVMVAHSDDSELFDQRLVYVPAANHEPGSLRPVYYDASSLGDRPEYHSYTLRRYVGTHSPRSGLRRSEISSKHSARIHPASRAYLRLL